MPNITLKPGESATITLRTAGTIAQQFSGQGLQAVFSLNNGQSVSAGFRVAESSPLPLPPVPATPVEPGRFVIQPYTVTNSRAEIPVVGDLLQLIADVTNTGGARGTIVINGITRMGDQIYGRWLPASVTLEPGQRIAIKLQSADPLPALFSGGGQAFVVLQVSDGQVVVAPFTVNPAPQQDLTAPAVQPPGATYVGRVPWDWDVTSVSVRTDPDGRVIVSGPVYVTSIPHPSGPSWLRLPVVVIADPANAGFGLAFDQLPPGYIAPAPAWLNPGMIR